MSGGPRTARQPCRWVPRVQRSADERWRREGAQGMAAGDLAAAAHPKPADRRHEHRGGLGGFLCGGRAEQPPAARSRPAELAAAAKHAGAAGGRGRRQLARCGRGWPAAGPIARWAGFKLLIVLLQVSIRSSWYLLFLKIIGNEALAAAIYRDCGAENGRMHGLLDNAI